MKRIFALAGFMFIIASVTTAQLAPGDKAVDFNLKNVDGKYVSLKDYANQKGVILVFTCIPCPFAKAYEQRIITLHKTYAQKGYPVVAINPNDVELSPDDTFEMMQERAKEKSYPYVYLKDDKDIFKAYGATRTPHVYLLSNDGNGSFKVAFIGAIDNNAMNEQAISQYYVKDAIKNLNKGLAPDPAEVKAIGCTIKTKK